MARCGCQGAGSTTCEAIVQCIVANLGPGLSYSNGRIQVRISRDGGNCIRYGSDQGIYAPCDGSGDPGGGRRTVAGLPDQAIAGSLGGAGLIHAYASPTAIEYAVANRIDIIDSYSYALIDGVSAWAPYTHNRDSVNYTNTPGGGTGHNMTSGQWIQRQADAGVPGGNPTGRFSDAPANYLTPDGGWYGWRQPPYQLMLTSQALSQIAARAVVMLTTTHPSDYDIPAHINAILALQAQDWVIPTVGRSGLASVDQYLDVGISHVGLSILQGENWEGLTASQIVDSGVTWVKIRETEDRAFIQSLVDAGLNVMSGFNARHTTAHELLDMGVRCLFSNDPVYHRGALGEQWQDYRVDRLTYQPKQTEVGTLTSRTHVDILNGRGFAIQSLSGRWYQPEFGWVNGVPRFNPSQTMPHCPIPNPDQYTIQIRVRIQSTLPTGNYPLQGMIIASDNDLDPSRPVTDAPPATRHGYLVSIRRGSVDQGQLVISRFNLDGSVTQLATSDTFTAAPANTWIDLTVEVDETSITLSRTDGTPYSVTVEDSTWRGPYFFYTWADTSGPGVTSPFLHGHDDVRYVAPGIGGQNWSQLAFTFEDWADMANTHPTWQDAAEG